MADDGRTSALRRRPALWAGLAVVLVAVGVTAGVLATRSTTPPPSPPTTRVVALGDSVPYGHGLANPYQTPQLGLPSTAVSQGPSTQAYPSLVAHALSLTMTVRPTNCHLDKDQLSISGAVADASDNTARDTQCPRPPQLTRNLADEVAAAGLAAHPARLVLMQAGADDIDFAACLENELVRVLGFDIGFGNTCVDNGTVTSDVAKKLAAVRASLAATIEEVSPYAKTVAVLDYYEPIPAPSQIVDGSIHSGAGTNLVCTALKSNAAPTASAAQVVLGALNQAIAGAVTDARAHHVDNVRLVDVSGAMNGHGMCTADPWVFTAQGIPATTLSDDLMRILAANACTATDAVHPSSFCRSLQAGALGATNNLKRYVWRVAHPTAAGQRALALATERELRAPAANRSLGGTT
jgi:hypothetical protein